MLLAGSHHQATLYSIHEEDPHHFKYKNLESYKVSLFNLASCFCVQAMLFVI